MNSIQKSRRRALVFNYVNCIVLLCLFYLIKGGIVSKSYLIFEILPVTGIMVSFKNVFGKSKLWQLTHSTFQALDERETELVYRATTISYSIFAIVTLILIYLFYLGGLGAIDVVLAAFLLYLAHTLPAAIIAWNQKVVIDED